MIANTTTAATAATPPAITATRIRLARVWAARQAAARLRLADVGRPFGLVADRFARLGTIVLQINRG
jgi:hypothetical protein